LGEKCAVELNSKVFKEKNGVKLKLNIRKKEYLKMESLFYFFYFYSLLQGEVRLLVELKSGEKNQLLLGKG